jgi:hypothetical protein
VKGIIFNVLGELVIRDNGEDAWDALLGQAAIEQTTCMHRGDDHCRLEIALAAR